MRKYLHSIALWTLTVFLWGMFHPIFAQNAAPVVGAVVGFRNSGSDFERQFRTNFSDALKNSNRLKLVPDPIAGQHVEEFWISQQKESNELLEEAYKNYIQGKRLYEQLEVDDAIKALSAAVRGYREGISAVRDNRYLLASHLYLGMALVIRGSLEEGKEFIRQMVVLDPKRDQHILPAREFPPKIVTVHTQLTKDVLAGPSGNISIRTRPSAATVYLDGVVQPFSPVEISRIPVGEHFVMLEKKGYGRFSKRVVVEPGANVVDVQLEEAQPLSPYPFAKRNDLVANDQLVKLGAQLGAQILVLARLTENADRPQAFAQLFDTRSKEFSKIESVTIDKSKVKKSAEELAKKLLNNITVTGLVIAQIGNDGDLPIMSQGPSESKSPRQQNAISSGPKPFYTKWWFWAIVGGVVAGGGGAALLMTKSESDFHVLSIQNPLK